MSFVLLPSTLWAQSPPGALVRSTHTESASTLALTLTSTALRTVRNKSIFFTQLLCYSNINILSIARVWETSTILDASLIR